MIYELLLALTRPSGQNCSKKSQSDILT